MFASGVRNNFPQVCFPRVANWRVARFFMFVRQFNDFCELLSRIFRNARQHNDFLVFLDTFPTVVQNGIVGSVFSPSSRKCFYNGLCFAQLNRRRGVEIWRALAMLWTLTTIGQNGNRISYRNIAMWYPNSLLQSFLSEVSVLPCTFG